MSCAVTQMIENERSHDADMAHFAKSTEIVITCVKLHVPYTDQESVFAAAALSACGVLIWCKTLNWCSAQKTFLSPPIVCCALSFLIEATERGSLSSDVHQIVFWDRKIDPFFDSLNTTQIFQSSGRSAPAKSPRRRFVPCGVKLARPSLRFGAPVLSLHCAVKSLMCPSKRYGKTCNLLFSVLRCARFTLTICIAQTICCCATRLLIKTWWESTYTHERSLERTISWKWLSLARARCSTEETLTLIIKTVTWLITAHATKDEMLFLSKGDETQKIKSMRRAITFLLTYYTSHDHFRLSTRLIAFLNLIAAN